MYRIYLEFSGQMKLRNQCIITYNKDFGKPYLQYQVLVSIDRLVRSIVSNVSHIV